MARPPNSLTDAELRRARRHLARRDPKLAALMKRVGKCTITDRSGREPFFALLTAIISQQLSTKAADTIRGRVIDLAGGYQKLTPKRLLEIPPDKLRAAGVSYPKIAYMRDLAERVLDRRLDLNALETAPDDEVVAAITSVKGLGVWSAEMFLMFRLNRPDVFPVGDLGIVKGVQVHFGMKRRPKPRTMIRLAENWRPYRTVAAWYLWRLWD